MNLSVTEIQEITNTYRLVYYVYPGDNTSESVVILSPGTPVSQFAQEGWIARYAYELSGPGLNELPIDRELKDCDADMVSGW
jgi:hypothetical protein